MAQQDGKTEPGSPTQSAIVQLNEVVDEIGKFDTDLLPNKQQVMDSLTGAVSALSSIETIDMGDPEYKNGVEATMDHLRRTLELMQAGERKSDELTAATETVAKTLAIMYPILKSIEKPARIPERPSKLPPDSPFKERRAAPRAEIEADIGFQSETNFFMGFTEDISTGGLFIATYDVRPMGSSLNINFTLPNGHLVSAEGIVRWVREYNETTPDTPPGMGVQFENLQPVDKEAIHSFIEERPAMFYDND